MKKMILLVTIITISFVLTGCGNNKKEELQEQKENENIIETKNTSVDKEEIKEKKQATIKERQQNDSNNQVVCSMTDESSGIEMKQEITLEFKSDLLDSASFVMTAVLPDEYKDYKSLFISTLESEFESYENTYGVKVNVNETSDGVKIDFKMDKSSFDEIYGSDLNSVSKNDVVSQLESTGYSCN